MNINFMKNYHSYFKIKLYSFNFKFFNKYYLIENNLNYYFIQDHYLFRFNFKFLKFDFFIYCFNFKFNCFHLMANY